MRTIFLYGYGSELTGRSALWETPWAEVPWLDGGRILFDRFDWATVENLYYEAAVLAQIDGIAPVLRGTQDAGFKSLRLLREVVEYAEPRGGAAPTLSPFVDTGCLGDVVSVALGRETPFDFENGKHLELVWLNILQPFFELFEGCSLERTPLNRRVLITWWKLAPSVVPQGMRNIGSAQKLLDHISERMETVGLDRPDHIVATDWPDDIRVYGKHAWFEAPGSNWSTYQHNGVTVGVAVPGFHDPASAPQPYRVIPRRNGDALREAFAGWDAAGAHIGYLESLDNVIESAAFGRSPAWTPMTLYLDITREYIESTRPAMPPPVLPPITQETPMFEPTTPILKDQLLPSADPACVRVTWPRGSATLLAFDNAGNRRIEPAETALDKDGAWQRGKLTDSGDVLFVSDTPDSVPTLVKGVGLK